MELKIDVGKIKNAVVCTLLFFAAINFYSKYFYFAFASLLFMFLLQKKIIIDLTSVIYILPCLLMAVYNRNEGVLSMLRCFAPVLLYWVGYNMTVVRSQEDGAAADFDPAEAQKNSYLLLLVMSFGSFSHYILNYVINFGKQIGRNTNDIWTGSAMAATGQTALACLMLGLAVAMIILPPRRGFRAIGAVCIVGVLAYNLILACRTSIVILLIVFAVGFLYAMRVLEDRGAKQRLRFCIIGSFLLLAVIFAFDIGGIQKIVMNSSLFARFSALSKVTSSSFPRLRAKLAFLSAAYKYPFGGLNMRAMYGYAHDLLLDGYDEYGAAGFIMLAGIIVSGMRRLWIFLRRTDHAASLKLAFLCVYAAVLLEFCVEPILTGMAWLFPFYCLINGSLTGLNAAYFKKQKDAEK